MILLEKYNITNGKNELLTGWTKVFNCSEDVVSFLKSREQCLFGGKLDKFQIVIRNIGEPYKKDSDADGE